MSATATPSTAGTVNQTVYNVRNYGTNTAPDAIKKGDAHLAAGSNVLTSASGTFAAADVGKSLTVIGAGPVALVNGVNVVSDVRTVIVAWTSATEVTLAMIASTTVLGGVYFYGTDLYDGLQAAVNAASAAGGGTVHLEAGAWYLSKRINIKSGVNIEGVNRSRSIIYGGASVDYMFYYGGPTGIAPLTEFVIANLTLDNCWICRGSVLRWENATYCRAENVSFLNTHAWGAVLGQPDPATNTALSAGNAFVDCEWNGHNGTLEMLLLFNVSNTSIIRCRFIGNLGGGPVLGLWQKCYGTYMERPYFYNCIGTCIYYSFTCDNTVIRDLYAEKSGAAISGANVSDWGQFGVDWVDNLQILGATCIGNQSIVSAKATAITLGSVKNCTVRDVFISGYGVGINVTATGAHMKLCLYVDILNPKIRNCNAASDDPILHPAIALDGRFVQFLKILGGALYDDQAGHTQLYPISIGGGPITNLTIRDVVLAAPTLASKSIVYHDNGTIGPRCVLADNQAFIGTHPNQYNTPAPTP